MYSFILDMYFNSIDPNEDNKWMNFDKTQLLALLEEPFFEEYKRTLPAFKTACKREFPMLDVYAFVRLQAYATTILPQNDTWVINYIWTFEDFIEQIIGLHWYETISIVYKSLGIHWFADNAENDPIKYKWACYAVSACKRSGMVSDSQLKRDLNAIYKEMLIAFAIRGTLEKNQYFVEYVQDTIDQFDEERINKLVSNIKTLTEQNEQLIDENKQLGEGMNLLRKQISDLQNESSSKKIDNLEEIAFKINFLSPQTDGMDEKVKQFKEIWDQLDKTTKKDIKVSFSMFEKFDSFDLALFPMLRSLEHEMNQNFFIPFHSSTIYQSIEEPICNKNNYKKTHDALIIRPNSHPTMGNIAFIGRAINDRKALESSNVIRAFSAFLDDKRNEFMKICRDLDTYRIGLEKFKLVELRNGIAHGDDNITMKIDKSCYEDVRKVLYEPPVQILTQIIKNSKR